MPSIGRRTRKTPVSHHASAQQHRHAQAVAADKFLAGMAERLQSEFGIAASTVRALAVTARLPASDVGDGSDDEAQHMPGGRPPSHKIGGQTI